MREYTVELGGLQHTLQLSDEDAKARGLTAEAQPAAQPQPQQPEPQQPEPAAAPAEKAAKPSNKADTPANK
jgi:hypothetical protein